MLRSIKPIHRLFYVAAIASALSGAVALTACSSSVTCEAGQCPSLQSQGGDGGSGSTSGGGAINGGGGAAPAPLQLSAVIYGTDPLTLRVTSFPLGCSNPTQDAPFDQCAWSTMEVTFPAAMAVTGGAIDLLSPDVHNFFQYADLPGAPPPNNCGATGGTGGQLPGTSITFVSVDPASVQVDVEGFDTYLTGGIGLNGMYTAPRCQ